MQVLITQDQFSYVIEPYGTEDRPTYWVSPLATQLMWDAGWRPYEMPRLSKPLFSSLWSHRQIRRWEDRPSPHHSRSSSGIADGIA